MIKDGEKSRCWLKEVFLRPNTTMTGEEKNFKLLTAINALMGRFCRLQSVVPSRVYVP